MDRIPENRFGTRFAASPRGADARAADFRSALVRADRAGGQAQAPSVDAAASKHIVKAGETLYGIASARLAAAGERATPGASMRYALWIAKANQIRNPDRIHAGQQLGLDLAAATVHGSGVAAPAAVEAPEGGIAGTRVAHEPPWRERTIEVDHPDVADESASDAADTPPPIPASAVAGRDAADAESGVNSSSAVAARAEIALYRQTAPAAAPEPPGALPDIVYKGMIGKALDLMPLEPSARTGLQQANAVIGSSLAGRSLAMLTGLGGSVLTIAGLIWGIFSAQKIGATASDPPTQVAHNSATDSAR